MIAPLARTILFVCLLVVAAIAALMLVGEWRWAPPPARAVDASLYDVPALAHDPADLAMLAETVERPLFMPTRRPPSAAPVEVAAEQPDPLADVRVLGLFGSGQAGGAILLIDGKPQRVQFGEKTGPWALRNIQGKTAHFTRDDGQSAVLELVHLPQVDMPPRAPAAGAAAIGDQDDPASGIEPEAASVDSPQARTAAARVQARAAARARRLSELRPEVQSEAPLQ